MTHAETTETPQRPPHKHIYLHSLKPVKPDLLSAAIRKGDALIVSRLLREGADPNGVETHADGTSHCPLSYAVTAGHPNVVRILLDAGADPDVQLASSAAGPLTLVLLATKLQVDPRCVVSLVHTHQDSSMCISLSVLL